MSETLQELPAFSWGTTEGDTEVQVEMPKVAKVAKKYVGQPVALNSICKHMYIYIYIYAALLYRVGNSVEALKGKETLQMAMLYKVMTLKNVA